MSMSGSLGGAYDLSAFQRSTSPTTGGSSAGVAGDAVGSEAAGAGTQVAGGQVTGTQTVGGRANDAQAAGGPGVGAQAGVTVPGPYVVDVTAESLQGVINTSAQLPVVAVFHSAKSANSGTLVQMLEEVAQGHRGRFQLAKVDVDVQIDVAQAFGVNAVPAAVALFQGQPIPLFQGLPEQAQLTQTVDQILQVAAQYGMTAILDGDADASAPEPDIPPLHKEGLEALESGDLAGAHAAYTKALAQNPGDSEAQTALHQVELLQRIAALDVGTDSEEPNKLLTEANDTPLTDVDVHLRAADVEFSYGRPDAAMSRLIDVVRATIGEERDAARERLLAYFDILGPGQELVVAARKELTNALF